MSNNEIFIAIFIMAIIGYFTRALPFLFFNKKEPSPTILFIENYFPAVMMTILVFFTIKNIDLTSYPYGTKELIAIIFTAFLHLWKSNYLLSIFGGTITYMFLVQY